MLCASETPAGRFEAKPEVQSEGRGHSNVVLGKQENVRRAIAARRVADVLEVFERGCRFESSRGCRKRTLPARPCHSSLFS